MAKVRIFGYLKDIIGKKNIEVKIKNKMCIERILKICKIKKGNSYTLLLNGKKTGIKGIVRNEDELCVFPPVSGG